VLSAASAINSGSYFWIPIAATLSLSGDNTSVLITPANPLRPGWSYQIRVTGVFDYAGNPAQSVDGPGPGFTTSNTPDNTPPSVILTPPDGSTVPINTRIAAQVTKAILPQPAAELFRVTTGGQPVF